MIRKTLLALCTFVSIWSQDADAQCMGNLQAGQICGNPTGSPAPARGALPSAFTNFGAGIDTNILATGAVIVSAPTVDSAFCGKTAALGGGGFFTFTVGVASGFSANCSILVVNTDSGRAKKMAVAGIAVGQNNRLWPNTSFLLKNINNVWTVVGLPTRWVLPATTTFFVDNAGSNNNDCLAVLAANACQTITGAMNLGCSEIDANLQNFIIKTVSGQTYTEHLFTCQYIGASQTVGYGQAVVDMTGSILSATGGSGIGIFSSNSSTPWVFKNTEFSNCAVACIEADSGGLVALDGVKFNGVAGNHIASFYNSRIVFINNGYTIAGGAGVHWYSQYQGEIFIQPSKTVTLTGPPNFALFFGFSAKGGLLNATGTTYSGTATGTRFFCDTGGGIDTAGGAMAIVTFTAANDQVTWTAHKLFANEPVMFTTTGTLAAPLVAGTTYFVKTVIDANNFTLSATAGGALIDLTTAGAPTNTGQAPLSLLPGSVAGTCANPGWFQ